MSWNKPQKPWHWLLLLTPALELMFIPFVADRWGSYLLPHDEIPGLTLLIYNLPFAVALSMALGMWQAWDRPRWTDCLFEGLALGFVIAAVNGTIAFAGCASGLIPS